MVSCSPDTAQASYIHCVVGASLELLPGFGWCWKWNPGLASCMLGRHSNEAISPGPVFVSFHFHCLNFGYTLEYMGFFFLLSWDFYLTRIYFF